MRINMSHYWEATAKKQKKNNTFSVGHRSQSILVEIFWNSYNLILGHSKTIKINQGIIKTSEDLQRAAIMFYVLPWAPREDLNLGERCAAQHSGQDLGAAIVAFTIRSLLESELQSEEETAGLCVEVGSIFGICTPLDVCAQSNKGKNEKKGIRQLRFFMYL